MSAASLSTEQRAQLRQSVVELASAKGYDQWDAQDAAAHAGLSPSQLSDDRCTKSALVLEAAATVIGEALDAMADGTAAKVAGRTPRSRILRTLGIVTDLVIETPTWGRSVLQALAAGREQSAPAIDAVGERLHMAVARALAGGEPGDPEWATAGVILQVWLAAVVAWGAGLRPSEHIEEAVVRALRVLRVNQ